MCTGCVLVIRPVTQSLLPIPRLPVSYSQFILNIYSRYSVKERVSYLKGLVYKMLVLGLKMVSGDGWLVVCFSARINTLHGHTDRVHVNMSSINMYVGRERSSGLIKMTCYVTFL